MLKPTKLFVFASTAMLLACGGAGEPAPSDESLDAHMAALGVATLECLGTVGPEAYEVSQGTLSRRFERCADGREPTEVDALLGVQRVDRRAAEWFSERWTAWSESFRADPVTCPSWERMETMWILPAAATDAGHENHAYRVFASGDDASAVKAGVRCAGGFGSQFLVDAFPDTATIVVDPTWWLVNTKYAPDANPFLLAPDYYHAMSFYGPPPGALYGAVNRAGEPCSKYVSGFHFLGRLKEVECSPGWVCMTQCQ